MEGGHTRFRRGVPAWGGSCTCIPAARRALLCGRGDGLFRDSAVEPNEATSETQTLSQTPPARQPCHQPGTGLLRGAPGQPRPASRRLPPAPPAAPKPPVRGAGAGRRQPWADPAQNWVGPPPASLPGVEGTYSLDSSGEAEGRTARGGQVRCPENLSEKKGARRRALRPRARLGGCRHVQLGSARGQRPAGSRTGPRKGRCGRSSCGLGGGHVAVRRKCRLMKCRRKATVTAAR